MIRTYLVQLEPVPAPDAVDATKFERIRASSHRAAALEYGNLHAPPGDGPASWSVIVALARPENMHKTGVPRCVHVITLVREGGAS